MDPKICPKYNKNDAAFPIDHQPSKLAASNDRPIHKFGKARPLIRDMNQNTKIVKTVETYLIIRVQLTRFYQRMNAKFNLCRACAN